MKQRILFISNLYPNPLAPDLAAYNRQQIAAISKSCEVTVISPVPWRDSTGLLPSRMDNGVSVHHPRFYYTPKVLRNWYGEFFYFSIKGVAKKLLKAKRHDCVYSSWLYPDSWAAAELAKAYHLPLFVKVHGTDVNRLVPGTPVAERSLEVVRRAEKVICVSSALKDRLIQLGAAEDKLEVVYNGVDHSIFRPLDRQELRRKLGVAEDEVVVLYVGNLKREKGLAELLEAFKLASGASAAKWRLVIIGKGAFLSEVTKIAASLMLGGKVMMLGSLPLGEISGWMNAATMLCLPSYMEGVPNVILEALSCGTPVVATDVGGIPELDRGEGLLDLVPARTIEPLAAAIGRRAISGGSSRQRSRPHSWQENAKKMLRIITGEEGGAC